MKDTVILLLSIVVTAGLAAGQYNDGSAVAANLFIVATVILACAFAVKIFGKQGWKS